MLEADERIPAIPLKEIRVEGVKRRRLVAAPCEKGGEAAGFILGDLGIITPPLAQLAHFAAGRRPVILSGSERYFVFLRKLGAHPHPVEARSKRRVARFAHRF